MTPREGCYLLVSAESFGLVLRRFQVPDKDVVSADWGDYFWVERVAGDLLDFLVGTRGIAEDIHFLLFQLELHLEDVWYPTEKNFSHSTEY